MALAQLPVLNDESLEEVYQWIGAIPLSRPVRNVSKDLSDGVLIAEIISHYLPRYITLNNFTHVNSAALKRYNWDTMQKMVFKYLNFQLTPEQIKDLVNGTCGVVESFLLFLRDKIDLAIAERRFRPTKKRSQSAASRGSTLSLNQTDSEFEREESNLQLGRRSQIKKIASTPKHQMDLGNGHSKEEQIQKLLAQVQYLERIIDQKDEHIAALTRKIEQTNLSHTKTRQEEDAATQQLKDLQHEVLVSQIHYLESVVQQKDSGIAQLTKQVERLMEIAYPEVEHLPNVTSPHYSSSNCQSPVAVRNAAGSRTSNHFS